MKRSPAPRPTESRLKSVQKRTRPKADLLPNRCRPLQIVHGLDQWPDTSDDGLQARLRALQEAGFGGIVANVSFKNYLRDEAAFELLRRGVRLAHAAGLRVWIYDEEGYPSPAAGGRVLEAAPSVEAKGLIRVVDQAGRIRHETVRLYEGTHATENFYQKRACPNLLDPLTATTFLHVTHDRYAALLRPLARYVEAFFTDEPALIPAYIPKDRDYPPTLAWHERVPAEFRARKGYDLQPHLDSLFLDTGPIDRKVRCDFYDVIAALCAETFFGKLQTWCRRHRVASSGHLLGEETMVWQTMFNGNPFPCYRRFDLPGIDMITSDPEKIMANDYFMVPRIAGSAGRLHGHRRLMCEISDFFGIMDGRHASIDQMRCTAAILFAAGVTDLCSYYALSFNSAAEQKPNEFPVPTFRPYADFVSRLNARFTAHTIETRVAVLYPITSLHANFTPSHRSMYEPHPRAEVRMLDGAFTDLCRRLLQDQVDFDVVDEASLAGARGAGRTIVVGRRRYDVLVLPPMDTVRLGTMKAIARFAAAGGAVATHALVPRFAAEGPDADARVVAAVSRLREAGATTLADAEVAALPAWVKSKTRPRCEFSPASPHLLCTKLEGRGGPSYFVINVSAQPYVGRGIIPDQGTPLLYSPATGRTRPTRFRRIRGAGTQIPLKLRPFESVFIDLRTARRPKREAAKR